MADSPSPSVPGRWPLGPLLVLLAVSWLAFTWPWLSGTVTVPWDAKAHFYPQLVFLAQALKTGESPLWTPFVFSGSPQVADPQSLLLSPPHWLLARLNGAPGFAAADAVPFAALLAGAGAIVLFFRDRGWHPAGAVVAGIAFMFGGSAAWRIQHVGQVMSLAYFPIVLWLLDRGLRRASFGYGAAAGLVAGVLVLGRDQVAGLSVLLLAAYAATVIASERLGARAWRPLIAGALVGGAIVILPLLMTFITAAASNRAVIDYDGAGRGSLHPAALITGFIANVFGTDGEFKQFWGPPSPLWGPVDLYIARNMSNVYSGALVVLALVFGAAGGGLFKRGARFFAFALIVMMLYTLGRYTPFFRLAYEVLPGVDLFRRPADGTFLIGALAAYCAGHVVHVVASHETGFVTRAGRVALSVSFAAVMSAVALAVSKGRLGYAWPMIAEGVAWLVLAVLAAVMIRRIAPARPVMAAAALALVMTADLARNNGPNESTALPPAMFDVLRPDSADPTIGALKAGVAAHSGPDRLDRVELAAIDFHWPNASLIHRLHNTLGYNPLRDGRYSAIVGAGDHVALADQRNFPATFPSYASPLADLLGLRYIATRAPIRDLDKTLPEGRLREVARTATATLYENPNALPRVMLVPRAEATNFDTLATTGQWPRTDFQDVVLFSEMPAGAPAGTKRGTATIKKYGYRQIDIQVDSPEGGFLVLNNPFHPWWAAFVDGYPAEILRANLLFQAVQLPPGRYEVTFRFSPLRGLFKSLTERISGRAPR